MPRRAKLAFRGFNGFKFNPDWNRTSWSQDYPTVFCPDHPAAWPNGYIYIHRLVAEKALGRLLQKTEVVHHLDENKENFSANNLEVLTGQNEHQKKHAKPITIIASFCPNCGRQFQRRKGRSAVYCSRQCSGVIQSRHLHSKRSKGINHGSVSAYGYHKCRCGVCKEGQRVRMAQRRLGSRSEADIAQSSED
jgi:hypothetical protein